MNAINVWLFLWIHLLTFPVLAQEKQLIFHALTVENGLSEGTNAFVFEDSYGFVWISSIDGLNRYDGSRVTVYKPDSEDPGALYGSNIQSPFFEDGNGDIWFSTEMAINCYRRKKGRFEHFFIQSEAGELKDVLHYIFHLDKNGRLWVAVADQLYRFDTHRPAAPASSQWVGPQPRAARCGVDDQDQNVKSIFTCFWDYGPGFEQIDLNANGLIRKRTIWFDGSSGQPDMRPICRDVCLDKNGIAFFATDKGLLKFDPEHPGLYRLFQLENKTAFRSVSIFDEKHLLVVTSANELWMFDTLNNQFVFKIKKNIIGNGAKEGDFRIMAINVSERRIWCSEYGNGVFFAPKVFAPFRRILGKKGNDIFNFFTQIYEDPAGNIFCFTRHDSTYVFNAGGQLTNRLDLPDFSCVMDVGGYQPRILSPQGIYDLNPESPAKTAFIRQVGGIPKTNLYIQPYKNDQWVVGNLNGLFLVAPGQIPAQKLPIPVTDVLALWKDRSSKFWIGESNRLETVELFDQPAFKKTTIFENTGLVNQIAGDHTDTSLIWIGTASGLLKANTRTLKAEFVEFPEEPQHYYVQSLAPDHSGNIWMATTNGVVKYTPSQKGAHQFKRFGLHSGLEANEYARGAATMVSTGEIWFAGSKGIDVFHPDSVKDIGKAPILSIVGLKIHDKKWLNDSISIETVDRIELPYFQNTLRLDLAALEYTNPSRNLFKARLFGADTAWTQLGNQNFITFANLPAGRYTFQFTASNAEGVWQPAPAELEIFIRPPYWQTWWFKSMVGLTLLGLVAAGTAFYYRYRLRMQQLQAEKQRREQERQQLELEKQLSLEQQRNRIAEELHDELGSMISSISILSEAALHQLQDKGEHAHLGIIGERSRQAMTAMSDIVWSVNPRNDSMERVLERMREFAVELFESQGITLHFEADDQLKNLNLPMEKRKEFYLVFKEAANNAAKYARASQVWVVVTSRNGCIQMEVRDNGTGFDPAKVRMGNGLWNMQKRAERMHARLEISSASGNGTSVVLHLNGNE